MYSCKHKFIAIIKTPNGTVNTISMTTKVNNKTVCKIWHRLIYKHLYKNNKFPNIIKNIAENVAIHKDCLDNKSKLLQKKWHT